MYIQWKRALPREGFECIYNGQEPSQEKVLSVYTMDKSPPKRRFRVYIQWKRGQGRSWGGVCPYIYIYIHTCIHRYKYRAMYVCIVLSCLVLSCLVLSCLVLSCLVLDGWMDGWMDGLNNLKGRRAKGHDLPLCGAFCGLRFPPQARAAVL